MKRRFFSFLIVICVMLTALPSGVLADSTVELTATNIKGTYNSKLTAGSYKLKENIELDSTLSVRSGEVVLDLNGYILSQKNTDGSVIKLEEGAKLTLNDSRPAVSNVVLNGGYITDGRTRSDVSSSLCGGGVYVSKNAIFTMNSGTIYLCDAAKGGGIYIAEKGKVIMNGGNITSCQSTQMLYAGGVHVENGATFEMNKGTIGLCIAYAEIGSLLASAVTNSGTFTMKSGATLNNGYNYRSDLNTMDNAPAFSNGGVFHADGGVVQGIRGNSGTIDQSGDTATAFRAFSSQNVLNSGTISGGEYDAKIFNAEDGAISGGVFENETENHGTISGGVFENEVENLGTISGGTFKRLVNNTGVVSGGNFSGGTSQMYSVTFETNGMISSPETQKRYRAAATEPQIPEVSGYKFLGWYLGDDLYDFGKEVTKDITLTGKWREAEFYALDVGTTYYFDLSSLDITGSVNNGELEIDGTLQGNLGENLPDDTLHYVPFTYVGTVDSYALVSNQTANDVKEQARSLFIADMNITDYVSWNSLNEKNLIFGKEYANNNITYLMRAPTGGNSSTGSGSNKSGLPSSNDWDTILNKNGSFIKKINPVMDFSQKYSLMQDSAASNSDNAIIRSLDYSTYINKWKDTSKSRAYTNVGYRPVIEIPSVLNKNDVKAVNLNLNGGSVASNGTVKIVVKSGVDFAAPSCEGISKPQGSSDTYFCWIDEKGEMYRPNDTVPATVSTLSAKWFDSTEPSVYMTSKKYYVVNGTGSVYFASYNDTKLVDACIKQANNMSKFGNISDIGLDVTDANKLKIFMWGENLLPACKSYDVSIGE